MAWESEAFVDEIQEVRGFHPEVDCPAFAVEVLEVEPPMDAIVPLVGFHNVAILCDVVGLLTSFRS